MRYFHARKANPAWSMKCATCSWKMLICAIPSDDTWSNVTAIREALTTFKAEREAAGLDKMREVDSVIAEVKVLQGLIEQFSVAKSAKPKLPSVEQSPAPNSFAEKFAKDPDERRPAHTEDRMALAAPEIMPYQGGEQMLPIATGLDDDAILAIVRDGLEKNCVDLILQPIVRLPSASVRTSRPLPVSETRTAPCWCRASTSPLPSGRGWWRRSIT